MAGLDVICVDLQLWFGQHFRMAREQDIAVGLVCLGLLCIGLNLQLATKTTFGMIVQHELEYLRGVTSTYIMVHAREKMCLLRLMQQAHGVNLGAAMGSILLYRECGLPLGILLVLR